MFGQRTVGRKQLCGRGHGGAGEPAARGQQRGPPDPLVVTVKGNTSALSILKEGIMPLHVALSRALLECCIQFGALLYVGFMKDRARVMTKS